MQFASVLNPQNMLTKIKSEDENFNLKILNGRREYKITKILVEWADIIILNKNYEN